MLTILFQIKKYEVMYKWQVFLSLHQMFSSNTDFDSTPNKLAPDLAKSFFFAKEVWCTNQRPLIHLKSSKLDLFALNSKQRKM